MRSQRFTYDELNRIATARTQDTTGPQAWGLEFGYDIWANLLSASVIQGSAPMLSVAVTAKNQISEAGFVYDAAGNLVQTPAPGALVMAYDAENRMMSAAGVSYSYDGDGKRVAKSNGKLYWYPSAGLRASGMSSLDALVETDAAGNNPTEYIFFGGKRIARRDPNGSVFYFFADHLGSSRVVNNATGTIVDESDYYPFGGERIVVNNDPNPYKFTGKERDSESGLDFFGARYYASTLARFTSADPITVTPARTVDPQQLNLYAYVRNNPLILVDPTGMIIDTSELSDKDRKKWEKIVQLANARDKQGNLLHPKLNEQLRRLQDDKRVFLIAGGKLSPGTAGKFEITKFSGNDFSEARITLDFKQIGSASPTTRGVIIEDFTKFEGLKSAEEKFAAVFGHESGHATFALDNPAEGVRIQQLLNDRDTAFGALPTKGRYPLPPDVIQKMETAERALMPTERHAQQVEKIITGELRASQKERKK